VALPVSPALPQYFFTSSLQAPTPKTSGETRPQHTTSNKQRRVEVKLKKLMGCSKEMIAFFRNERIMWNVE